jgi:hypothetical protein
MGALFLVAGMLVVPAVPAAGDDGVEYRGNLTCEDLDATWTTLYKADFDEGAPASGSHGPVTWGVRDTSNGEVVDWTSTTPLIAVLVKGGPGGYEYDYSPAGTSGGTGLHALERPSGSWADISHVTFCQAEQPPPEPATVTVTKQMVPPDDSVAFTFTSSLPGFPVDLGHNQSATAEVEAGTYAVTEATIPGWILSDIDCTGAGGAVSDLGTGTVNVTVAAGDNVNCTFTNEQAPEPEPATLTLAKVTDPADDDVSFRFFGPNGWKPVLGHGDSSTIEVEPGTYTMREKFDHAWDLTSIVCDGGDPAIDLAGGTATVTVGDGDHVTCTYTNTVTCPFTSDAVSREGDPFLPVLNHGDSDYVMVQPGTYSITELGVPGWTLGSVVCDDPDSVVDLATATATVTVSSDELATCVFTNNAIDEPDPGELVIRKSTDPRGSSETWTFTSDIAGFEPVLGDGESASVSVDAGTYTVTEQLDQNWKLTNLTCTDPEAEIDLAAGSATVVIPAGETVTCTYTNTRIPEPEPATIVIEKETDPVGSPDEFGFLVIAGEDMVIHEAELSDGERVAVEVDPGSYAIYEVFHPDWDLAAISCSPDGDVSIDRRTARVAVDAGETVTCTFTNARVPETPPGRVIVEKVTEPAGADQAFEFTVMMGDGSMFDGPLRDGESVTVEFTTPDRIFNTKYVEIGEMWVDGWRTTDITCDADPVVLSLENSYVGLEVDPGETVTCTFTNTQETPRPLGSIGDFVWNDVNRNGVQDPDEPGIPGVRVNLYAPPGAALGSHAAVASAQATTDGLTLLATTKTDSAGKYLFSDLPAGDYVVEFTGVPTGYNFTTPFAAARTIDSDAGTTDGRTPVMVLAEGFHDTTCDAGLYIVKGPTGEILPVTGADLMQPLVAGTALLALGLVLVAATRPRRQTV